MNHFVMAPRRCLFRLLAWFFFINSLIASLIIFGYLPIFTSLTLVPGASTGSSIFAWFYFILAFFAQVSIYEFASAIICAIVATLFPWRTLIIGLASILSAGILAALIGDAIAFRLYHMHYASIGWQIYQAGAFNQVLPLGYKEHIAIYISFAGSFSLETLLALFLWRLFYRPGFRVARRLAFTLVFGSWIFVYASFSLAIAGYFWPEGYRYAILRAGRVVPYMSEFYVALLETNKPIRQLAIGDQEVPMVVHDILQPLNYPMHPLSCSPPKQKMNIVIIGIDTWRFTSMNKRVSPNIYRFSQQASQFNAHFSGGNCTQPGLFSLFYSLPPNYWRAFLQEEQGPVFIDQLARAGYDLGIFLSATINFPRFDKTVFVDVKHLRKTTHGANSLARDRQITREFLTFLKHKDAKKPFFSFLFYDALHNYCEPARPHFNPFQPALGSCDRFSLDNKTDTKPYQNLYDNKMLFIDQEVGKVLKALRRQKLLENTVIIITADHGEELNDGQMGLWGHASAYNSYQLHVPMLVYWPHQKSKIIRQQTTHYDIAPTLLQGVLGCSNNPEDYSVGHHLLSQQRDDFFVAGSYGDYAIVMPNQVMRIFPDGDYNILDRDGHYVSQKDIDPAILLKVLHSLRVYYKPGVL